MGIDFTGIDNLKGMEPGTDRPKDNTNSLIVKRHADNVEEVKKIYKEYQDNIRLSEELRIEILKATNQSPTVTKELFLKAIKIVGLLCHEPTFYNQIEKNINK